MSNRSIIALVLLAVVGFLLTQTFYTVDPTKQVLVRQFGAIVGEPKGGTGVAARYFTPLALHEAMAVTGGICIASACKLPGTVAAGIAVVNDEARENVTLEHPSGVMDAVITTGTAADGSATILGGGTLRTARRIMKGEVYIPATVWAGHGA